MTIVATHDPNCNSFLGMDCNCSVAKYIASHPAQSPETESAEPARYCQLCHDVITLGTFHENCQKCYYCGEQVGIQVIESLLRDDNDKDYKGEDTHKILVWHRPCRESYELKMWKAQPVTITQEVLDILNRKQLMYDSIFEPNLDLSVKTNQDLCKQHLTKAFENLDTDQMHLVLMNLQSLAADIHLALGTDGKESARARLAEREKSKIKAVKDYRENQEKVAQQERVDSRERAAKKIQLDAERQNPQLKADRKAIETLMKFTGVSEETARKKIEEGRQSS
jgi:hypothetical protein